MASSAVKDIRKRIQSITDAISKHRKAIKELKQQKRVAQQELNALGDPMSRLPLELSSLIFKKCVPLDLDDLKPDPLTAPMLLMRICRSWTQIALATPSLWTCIHVNNQSEEFANLINVWIDRAQRLPVKIFLSGARDSEVEDVVTERAGQLVELEVSVDMDDLPTCVEAWDISSFSKTLFPILEKLTLGPTRLTYNQWPGVDACLEFIHNAPRLTECTLYRWSPSRRSWLLQDPEEDSDDSDSDERPRRHKPRIHPCIRRLHLGRFRPKCTADVLRHLTLPALEFLHLSAFDIKAEEFDAFLTRSGVSLQTLRLAGADGFEMKEYRFQTDAISLCRLVPLLQNLYISFGEYDAALPFFNALLTEPGFLPDIVSLTLHVPWPDDLSVLCEKLREVLSARRSIQYFKLIPFGSMDRGHVRGQPPLFERCKVQICAALESLVDDGMHLEVLEDVKDEYM